MNKADAERLRDTFAAAALTGLLVNGPFNADAVPRLAYSMADSMLRERERTNHDAVPEAKATNDGGTPKDADGTGNTPALSESEREAIEQMLDEVSGKARSESWVPDTLRNLLERLK
jgi:hypothetical protein